MKLGYIVALLLGALLLAMPATAKDCGCGKPDCGKAAKCGCEKSDCGCKKPDCGCEKVECGCAVQSKPKCSTDVQLLPTPTQDGGKLLPTDCCPRSEYRSCCDRAEFRLLCNKCGPVSKCTCEKKADDCGCKKDKCGCKPKCGKDKCKKSDCGCKDKKSDCSCKKSDCGCGKH